MKTEDYYRTEKAYFRNDPKYGRTTKLIHIATGEVVYEGMGVCSKRDLVQSMLYVTRMNGKTT